MYLIPWQLNLQGKEEFQSQMGRQDQKKKEKEPLMLSLQVLPMLKTIFSINIIIKNSGFQKMKFRLYWPN